MDLAKSINAAAIPDTIMSRGESYELAVVPPPMVRGRKRKNLISDFDPPPRRVLRAFENTNARIPNAYDGPQAPYGSEYDLDPETVERDSRKRRI